MTEEKNEVAETITERSHESEIEREAGSLVEKQQAIIRAETVILSEVEKWTGITVNPDDSVPIVRNGEIVGKIQKTVFSSNPVKKVAEASLIEHKTEINQKISQLQEVIEASKALIGALGSMKNLDQARLETGRPGLFSNLSRGYAETLPQRLITEIGTVTSASIAAGALITNANEMMGNLREELKKRETRPGRPRNEAAYAVARELAFLYAKITGKRPTYAAGADGYSGEYTPALRRVFDALGWEETDLRGPAEKAISAISDADMAHEEMPLGGLISSVWPG